MCDQKTNGKVSGKYFYILLTDFLVAASSKHEAAMGLVDCDWEGWVRIGKEAAAVASPLWL